MVIGVFLRRVLMQCGGHGIRVPLPVGRRSARSLDGQETLEEEVLAGLDRDPAPCAAQGCLAAGRLDAQRAASIDAADLLAGGISVPLAVPDQPGLANGDSGDGLGGLERLLDILAGEPLAAWLPADVRGHA